MRIVYYVLGAAAILTLTGCATDAMQLIGQLEADGTITPEKAAEMREVYSGGMAWLGDAVTVLGGAALAWLGIRLPAGILPGVSRGRATQKHGLAEDKIQKA